MPRVPMSLLQDAKEYLHRAGRTARIGQAGQAVMLLHPSEAAFLQLLKSAGVTPREVHSSSLDSLMREGGNECVLTTAHAFF